MDIILVPGLWLDGSSWERVVPVLERAGHRAHPLTLPGMESTEADRTVVTLRDHVDAVVAAIDAVDPACGTLLVGHSAGAAVGYAAADARPDRVAGLVCVGGFPTGDGDPVADGFSVVGSDVPLPDWSAFEEEEVADLDDAARADFRARAVPSPAGVVRDQQRLTDQRRYDLPVTLIATEFTTATLRDWIAQGMGPVREIPKFRRVRYVDLPAGHWPQFTRPTNLAHAILDAAWEAPGGTGRVSPPQFEAEAGADGWRVLAHGACAHFRTGSFATGLALVDAIGALAAAADHQPDIDLRPAGVTVRLPVDQTHRLHPLDLALARQITAAARERGTPTDPAALQDVDITIDHLARAEVMAFWRAVLGYEQFGDEDLIDPHRQWPSIWFQPMDAPRPQRNRIHVDVWVPPDQAKARVEAALAAGGRLLADHAPTYWTLADPEGNEVDVATWQGRGLAADPR